MKKFFLIFSFAFLCFFIPKSVFAAAPGKNYIVFDANYGVISQGNFVGSPGEWTQVAGSNATRVRFYFNQSFVAGCYYTMTLHEGYAVVGQYWSSAVGYYNLYLADQGVSMSNIVANNDTRSVNGNTYSRTIDLSFDFTAATTTTSSFFEVHFTNAPFRVLYIMNPSLDVVSSSCGSSGNNQDIIENQNQNTQNIINNQNQNTQNIINSQNETTDAINDLNDTLQETEIDDETIGDKVGEIQQISETPITDLLTMPITLLQKYYTGITGSCSSYNLGSLFNHNLTLPCINGQQLLGSTIWTIIDGLFVIFMVYNIGMMVVSFFESITSLNDTFDSMYQPQHATYHPRHGGDK